MINFDAAKFERRNFCCSGDTAREKSRIYYASNSVLAAEIPLFSKLFFYLGHVSGCEVVPDCRQL